MNRVFTIAVFNHANIIVTTRNRIQENAHMGDDKAQRLDDALSSLVDILVPVLPGEDEASADQRHDNALDLARSIIDKSVSHQRVRISTDLSL